MNTGQTVFAQLMDFLPLPRFRRCVQRYHGNRRVRTFSCLDQFLCMAFAQLTFRESLRDTVTCLRALKTKLYHAGIRGRVARSTLADANDHRDWRIFGDFAQVLIKRARQLYAADDFGLDLQRTVYALDSTTIDLCLTLFPWAPFRRHKGAIKLHTLLDLRGAIPCFIHISHGKTHDLRALDHLTLEPGAFYVMDRGYIDFRRLHVFTRHAAFFIVRSKNNLDYHRRASRPCEPGTGLRCDQLITLAGPKPSQAYPEPLRRVHYYDVETKQRLVLLTNHFELPALTIAELYRCRWQVELFFKWIKQHLRIKAFYGFSPNAVKTQVWIAITVYVLVAIVKRELGLERSLYEILQVLSLTLFEKTPLFMAFSAPCDHAQIPLDHNQLPLFDF